jgi:hypothetical protein
LASAGRPDDGFFSHLSDAWLAGYRGNCARLLGQPKDAIKSLQLGLGTIGPERPSDRSGVLADLAAAHGQQGDVEQACYFLIESFDLAKRSESRSAQDRIRGIRKNSLAQYSASKAVQEVDARLGS